jgi:hypothetical protein
MSRPLPAHTGCLELPAIEDLAMALSTLYSHSVLFSVILVTPGSYQATK